MLSIESLFDSTIKFYEYCTKNKGYNLFIIDNLPTDKLQLLKSYIDKGDKVSAIQLYRQLDIEVDAIRNYYCYNNLEYKSSFRQLAKDLHLELKRTWLNSTKEFKQIDRILRFISTSDYYIIREYFIKRSHSLFYMDIIPIDPTTFYDNYIPLEVFLDYAIKLYGGYIHEITSC